MKKILQSLSKDLSILLLGSIGGFLFSLTGVSIGWMVGTMFLLGVLSIVKPGWFANLLPERGFSPSWKNTAQLLLAIQIGKQMTTQIWDIFAHSWFIILGMLILSMILSIFSGIFLNRYSHVGIITSLYATAPGGLNNMPAIAEEVGANTVVVTIVQASRILLVVGLIPIFARVEDHAHHFTTTITDPEHVSIWWTGCLFIAAQLGYMIMKKLRFPAARMIGGIIGVALFQFFSSSLMATDLIPWYPSMLKILIQIVLGTSLGLSIKKEMFKGIGRITILGIVSSSALLFLMVYFSGLLSSNSSIPYLTAILAFAPGGVAEMTVTAMALQENVPFVASAQTLRIIMTFLLIPPLCRFLSEYYPAKQEMKKRRHIE